MIYKAFCRGDRIRTYGLVVPNDARYRAALHPESQPMGRLVFCFPIVSGRKKPPNPRVRRLLRERLLFRRSGRIRTYDLQHPMLARYQATLHPDWYWSDKGKGIFDSGAS